MIVLIVSSGELGNPESFIQKLPPVDYVIASDGGTRHLASLNMTPDLIMGDFDSVDPALLDDYVRQGVKIERFPTDKDKTDTQIAVDRAIAMGAKQVVMLGALGTRFDHSYANVLLLVRLAKHGIAAIVLNDHNAIFISDSMIHLKAPPGTIVSLLPIGSDAVIHATVGLQYGLCDALLPLHYPMGVSNVMTLPEARITISSGYVMAVLAQD